MVSRISKKWQNLFIHLLEVFNGTHAASFYDLLRLGDANLLHDNTGLVFDVLQLHFLLKSVESDAGTSSACSGSSA
jgi:hypothetical protein